MSALAEHIVAHAEALPEGTGLRAKELLHLGSRAAVDQALVRLERAGALSRIERGVYLRPRQGKYGPRTPSPAKVVQALASTTGEIITSHGAAAANALGLTTQTPMKAIYLTSGKSRRLKIGIQQLELRHARDWELLLPGELAGDAVRALAWVGPERAAETLKALKRRLPAEAVQTLLSLRGRLPTWLAQEVSSLACG